MQTHTPDHAAPVALTVKEFCASVRMGQTKFYEEVKHNRIRVTRIGRKNLITLAERDAYLALVTDKAA